MTNRILYVPHVLGRVNGLIRGQEPWLAEHPGAGFDGGQPVFATLQHATAWFAAALDQSSTGPIGLATVADVNTYLGADRRTRVHLHLTGDQLREPHRQVAFSGPQLHPDPRVLRGQFRIAGAEAHRRWPPRQWPQPGRLPLSGEHGNAAGPSGEFPTRPKRFAFASGYRFAYNNVWYATHARVAAALDTVAPAAAATVSARGDRCWRSAPPVPPSPTPVDPRPVPAGPFPALARQWATGLALGAAHGALHAAHDLRSTLLRLPHAMPGLEPDGLDGPLRHVLATTVPVWADHCLADWAISVSRDRASLPSPPLVTPTSMVHSGDRPPPPGPAPSPSPAGPLTPPTLAHQPPPLTSRHHRRNPN